ncbi:prolipoprotein diacylglyceryl transferase [Pelagivirga sediminicola]|uniref:Phosphatidylglycerol--prolipoprotein diacylglyceryl transferase n=1 Tax=Pelagivirga sediminicola TaxID=2170575 RepID=A0A2T7G792_9RHOB|nr:prolipoprotein diacylglyceryl transferase [Pelagivirga sediminicola]PVA10298.1 prolipoprotein diacylglyceryl transferase [Pelagivirga sediminicola]
MNAVLPYPDISPEIFSISILGMEFALRWYALAYIAGILLGWRIVLHAVRRPDLWQAKTPVMTPKQVEDLMFWAILGIILGGRLGFVLFYQPGYYKSNPLEILQVWQGGMSFHGGMLGVLVACIAFSQRHKLRILSVGDLLCMAAPAGLMLGRIANFINAELWGRPTDLPWGVIFPGAAAQDCPGVVGLCARHPSQLYEALLEGLVLGAVLLWLAYRRGALKRPGRITGWFFIGYGAARFIVELAREADAQFISEGNPLGHAVQFGAGLGLSMGQILSLPMIAFGIALLLTRPRAP